MAEELQRAEKKAARRGAAAAEAPSLLNDDRFSRLFSDPSFAIDKEVRWRHCGSGGISGAAARGRAAHGTLRTNSIAPHAPHAPHAP